MIGDRLVAPRPVDPLHFYAAFKLSTGEVVRRYEHDQPDAMIHVDVKKLGNIPTAPSTASSAASKANGTGPPTPQRVSQSEDRDGLSCTP